MTGVPTCSSSHSPRRHRSLRLVFAGALIVIFAASAAKLLTTYLYAWCTPWFEQRLMTSLAVAMGQAVYQIGVTGPLFTSIYGPLSYFAYLPAVLLPTVRSIFALASLTCLALLMLPLLLAALEFVRRRGVASVDALTLLLFSFAALAALRPLAYVASQATADSPAICLMALSALVLYLRFDRPTFAVAATSSLLLVLSIGCKQNMMFAGAVLLVAVFWFFPGSFAWKYAVTLAGASLLVVAFIAFFYHGIKGVYYNDVIVPMAWPSARYAIAVGGTVLLDASVTITLTAIGTVLIARVADAGRLRFDGPCSFVLIFFLIAIALTPFSIMTFAAWGGDTNAFAPAVYFLLLGTVLTSFDLISDCNRNPRFTEAFRVWLVVAGLVLVATNPRPQYGYSTQILIHQVPPAVQAYNYCTLNPGKVYFPANSIAEYLADRTFYHTYWGVMILVQAHQPLSRAEVLQYIPPRAQYVAVPQFIVDAAYEPLLALVAPHRIAASIAGLNDFNVFAIERTL
jgi:hypothetical protein